LGFVHVGRASDNVADGWCSVTGNGIDVFGASSGSVNVDALVGVGTALRGSCREHDANGGDCSISGELLCL